MTYIKAVLTVIALLLAVLAMRPAAVHADNDSAMYFVEPGTTPIRNLNGGIPGDGEDCDQSVDRRRIWISDARSGSSLSG